MLHRLIAIFNKRSWAVNILLLILGCAVLFLFRLGSHPLIIPDEGRYSEIAREMLASGNFITPTINGIPFLDKPVLFYWLQASAIRLFGVNEWAIRLWPAMLGVFGCIMTYISARKLYSHRTGIIAAILLATSPLYFYAAHYADMNIEVAVFITTALLSFLIAIKEPSAKTRTLWLILSYTLAACAFLTKGLIGIVFPTMIIGLWILLRWRFDIILKMRLALGLVIFAVIVAPWFVLVQIQNPEFLHYFFVYQHVTRFLGKNFNNPEPFWFYLPVIMIGILPWLIFLPQAICQHVKNLTQSYQKHDVVLFLLLWFLVVVIFFSMPRSKIVGYIIPALPPLILLIAIYIDECLSRKDRFYKIFAALTIITIALLWTGLFIVKEIKLPSTKPLALTLKKYLQPDDIVLTYQHYYQDLPFYLQRTVGMVDDWHIQNTTPADNWRREFAIGLKEHPSSPAAIQEHDFWQKWQDRKRKIYVITDKKYLPRFKNYHLLTTNSDIVLLGN